MTGKLTLWDMSALLTAGIGLVLAIAMFVSGDAAPAWTPWVTGMCLGHSIFWLYRKRYYAKR